MCHRFVVVTLLAAASLSACRSETPDFESDAKPRKADPVARRCGVARAATGVETARACAEWFVVRNGYADKTVDDTTILALEPVDAVRSAPATITARRNTVIPTAVLVCADSARIAYTVAFAVPKDSIVNFGRTVTMDSAFNNLHFEAPPFKVRLALTNPKCRKTEALP